jgi:hypothetical protein
VNGFRLAIAVFLASAAFGVANADDFIRVTFSEFCFIPCSLERSEIYVSRSPGPGWTVAEIDKFFTAIRKVLETENMPFIWNPIHGGHEDNVKIEIQLGEKRYSFNADYSSNGISTTIDEPPEIRRRRLALQHILELAADYSAKRYRAREAE